MPQLTSLRTCLRHSIPSRPGHPRLTTPSQPARPHPPLRAVPRDQSSGTGMKDSIIPTTIGDNRTFLETRGRSSAESEDRASLGVKGTRADGGFRRRKSGVQAAADGAQRATCQHAPLTVVACCFLCGWPKQRVRAVWARERGGGLRIPRGRRVNARGQAGPGVQAAPRPNCPSGATMRSRETSSMRACTEARSGAGECEGARREGGGRWRRGCGGADGWCGAPRGSRPPAW